MFNVISVLIFLIEYHSNLVLLLSTKYGIFHISIEVLMNDLFPVFLKIQNKSCLVIGGGNVAWRKVNNLLAVEAKVTIIAKKIDNKFNSLATNDKILLKLKNYAENDLENAFLVFVCTNDRSLNNKIYHDCLARNILVNVADSPAECVFYQPSVVSQGDLKIAISVNGKCCSLAKKIRQDLEKQYDEKYNTIIDYLHKIRQYLIKNEKDEQTRKNILAKIVNSGKLYDQDKINTNNNINIKEELKKWY